MNVKKWLKTFKEKDKFLFVRTLGFFPAKNPHSALGKPPFDKSFDKSNDQARLASNAGQIKIHPSPYIIKLATSVILLFFTFNFTSFAATSEVLLSDLKEKATEIFGEDFVKTEGKFGSCIEKVVPLFDLETLEFFKFLEVTFLNESSNSSLINIAIGRYGEYKKTLDSIFAELSPQASAIDNPTMPLDELTQYNNCAKIKDSYKDLAKQQMISHIQNTAYQKKTMILIEKYQNINAKVRELYSAISKMYAYFGTFENKLPGFLRKCVSS